MRDLVRPPNPYADLRALVDCTRQLDPEEVAELQLEQGYADRALRIYEALIVEQPGNAHYRRRRDWLARLATVPQRPVRCISASTPPPPEEPATRDDAAWQEESGMRLASGRAVAADATLRGMAPPTRAGSSPPPAVVRRLSIVRVGRR